MSPVDYLVAELAAYWDCPLDLEALRGALYQFPLENQWWAERWHEGERESLIRDLPAEVDEHLIDTPLPEDYH